MNKVPEQKREGQQETTVESHADEALSAIRRAGFGSALLDKVDRTELSAAFAALQVSAARVRSPRTYAAEPSHIFRAETGAGSNAGTYVGTYVATNAGDKRP